jgi:protein-tyrosine phosphatase
MATSWNCSSSFLAITSSYSVDTEAGCPNFFEKDHKITYKRIPIFDNRGEDILSHMDTAFNFIEHAKHHGHILVHCHKGISRSASFVIGYLMRKNEMTLNEALGHVQSVRPMIQPNDSFMEQLRRYEVVLNEQREREQLKQQSYNQKMSRGSNSEADQERDLKRVRMDVSGPTLPPSVDVQLTSVEVAPFVVPSAAAECDAPSLPAVDILPVTTEESLSTGET